MSTDSDRTSAILWRPLSACYLPKNRIRFGICPPLMNDDNKLTELYNGKPKSIQPCFTQSASSNLELIIWTIKSLGIGLSSAMYSEIRRAILESANFSRSSSCGIFNIMKPYFDARRDAKVALPEPRGPIITTRAVRFPFDLFGWSIYEITFAFISSNGWSAFISRDILKAGSGFKWFRVKFSGWKILHFYEVQWVPVYFPGMFQSALGTFYLLHFDVVLILLRLPHRPSSWTTDDKILPLLDRVFCHFHVLKIIFKPKLNEKW